MLGNYDPGEGDIVFVSGIETGFVAGEVAATGLNFTRTPHGKLSYQIAATYLSEEKDSGAPTFFWFWFGSWQFAWINGIHWAEMIIGDSRYALFSPQSGVEFDMGVVPLTS